MSHSIREISRHSSIYRGFIITRRPKTVISKITRYEVTLGEQSFGLFDAQAQATGYVNELYRDKLDLEIGNNDSAAVIAASIHGPEHTVGSIFKRRYEKMEPAMHGTDIAIEAITYQRRFPKQQCFAEGLQLVVLPFPESER